MLFFLPTQELSMTQAFLDSPSDVELETQVALFNGVVYDENTREIVDHEEVLETIFQYYCQKYHLMDARNEYQMNHLPALVYCYIHFGQYERKNESLSMFHYDNWSRIEDVKGIPLNFEDYYNQHLLFQRKSFEKVAEEPTNRRKNLPVVSIQQLPMAMREAILCCLDEDVPVIVSKKHLKEISNWGQYEYFLEDYHLEDFIVLRDDSIIVFPEIKMLLNEQLVLGKQHIHDHERV